MMGESVSGRCVALRFCCVASAVVDAAVMSVDAAVAAVVVLEDQLTNCSGK